MLNSQQRTRSTGFLPGALKTRHRRKNSASSLTDSDSGKPGSALPPLSPYGGYASSEVGSDQGINDLRPRGAIATDRFTRGQSELRRTTQRSAVGQFHYFIPCLYCSVVHFLCLLLQLSVTYSGVFSVPKFNFHAICWEGSINHTEWPIPCCLCRLWFIRESEDSTWLIDEICWYKLISHGSIIRSPTRWERTIP